MTASNDIRALFLDYFRRRGHTVLPGSSLAPANDPTLLFTNAGMVQFKEVLAGREQRPCPRAATAQRCVRAGGKHNDLENIGRPARHHTFFEMLGNFSFGDYFKEQAIRYAWELLTAELAIPPEKLWVTVYQDDDESADIWLRRVGVDSGRFSRCGESENFWSMGEVGPCGPCTEIFYDHGDAVPGGPPGSAAAAGDRFVEIWNLVFMQYDRNAQGEMQPLPRPSVDTGMGLERVAAVLQGVHDNYETDLFLPLIDAVRDLAAQREPDPVSTRVICDHVRSSAFLVADGVIPANEGRGYVLRRIIRRAVRHGTRLGFNEPFLHRLIAPLEELMGGAYPELSRARRQVTDALRQEEERFAETMEQGLRRLEETIASLSSGVIPGAAVFQLYDTYGFPVDLTADIARERGLELDLAGFEQCMEQQRRRARKAGRFAPRAADLPALPELDCEFTGYDALRDHGRVTALLKENRLVNRLEEGDAGGVILERTPCYAESGGQVGDQGQLSAPGGGFAVSDTQKHGAVHVHWGRVSNGALEVGQSVTAEVDAERRAATVRNHSATHLLYAALRQVLGERITQKGCLVAADYLRADFSHSGPVGEERLREVERLVNRRILDNAATRCEIMPLQEALKSGAVSLPDEKYGDQVRVLNIADGFSVELCGGTHAARAGDIGLFKITEESSIAAGVRRLQAVTGTTALARVEEEETQLAALARLLNVGRDRLADRLEQVLGQSRQLEKELEQARGKLAGHAGADLAGQAETINGVNVLARRLDGVDPKTLRSLVDQLKQRLGAAVIVLGTARGGKVSLVAGVTENHTDRIKAGDLVDYVATQIGGKGGGRADLAQAGGGDPAALQGALDSVADWVRQAAKV